MDKIIANEVCNRINKTGWSVIVDKNLVVESRSVIDISKADPDVDFSYLISVGFKRISKNISFKIIVKLFY